MLKDLDARSGLNRDTPAPEVMRALLIGAILGLAFWALVAWLVAAAI